MLLHFAFQAFSLPPYRQRKFATAMNCMLFNTPAPFKLEPSDPRVAYLRSQLKIPNGSNVYAGQAGEFICLAKVSYTEDGGALLEVSRKLENPPSQETTFCAAFSRPQIARRILFEAACFGIKNVIFYPANKGESAYAKSSLYSNGEYLDCLTRGAEQACSCTIPAFYTSSSLEECIAIAERIAPTANAHLRIAPDVYEATSKLPQISLSATLKTHKTVVIGGERGFNSKERDMLRNCGFELISLGRRVLRTDTAAICIFSAFAQ